MNDGKVIAIEKGWEQVDSSIVLSGRGRLNRSVPWCLEPFASALNRYKPGTPDMPCVYFLATKDNVNYVGQSKGLAHRLNAHRSKKRYSVVYYIPVDPTEMLEVEAAFIEALKPHLNIMTPGADPACLDRWRTA